MRQKFLLGPIFLVLLSKFVQSQPLVQVRSPPDGAKSVQVQIPENADLGTLLVDMREIFKFKGIRRIFSLQSSDAELIKVSEDGEVRLHKPLDFEELCVPSQPCAFESKIAVLPQEVFESILFTLKITNQNDNAPAFEQSSVSLSVNENHPAGIPIEVPELTAFDADLADSSPLNYKISPSDLFSIKNDDGRTFLVANKELDREETGFLTGVVEVTDQGGKMAEAEVEISIIDANDNRPVFEQDRYQVELLEGQPVGSEVLTARATDLDEGKNAEVGYKIVGATPLPAKYLFVIEPTTGKIRIAKEIKRQEFSTIVLKIKATDNGLPSLSSECEVEMKILDENDNDPKISLTPVYPDGKNPQDAVVNENEPIGSFVVWVKVTDEDFDANGQTDVALQPDEIFQMRPDDGVIVSLIQFDREVRDSYQLTVTACDRGTPKRCSSSTMMIKIGDVNDNSPIMAKKNISANLRENIRVGSRLMNIVASDADHADGFGKIEFSISGGEDIFEIDALSGDLILAQELDYETKTKHSLTVTASDPEGQSDSTRIEVQVLNVNDNYPQISAPDLVKVNQGHDSSVPIANIEVSDADGSEPILALSGENAEFFEISEGALYLTTNVTRHFDVDLTLVAIDGEDEEMETSHVIKIAAAKSWSAVVAGIGCGVLMFLIVVAFVLFKNCATQRYKLYDRITPNHKRSRPSAANRSEEILQKSAESLRKKSISVVSDRENASLLDGNSSGRPKSGIETDSGRGDSSSETHSAKLEASSVLGQFCQAECLTLGHSDACWLPRGQNSSHFVVEVTSSNQRQPTALSVWEETSDYSSHNETDCTPKIQHSSQSKLSPSQSRGKPSQSNVIINHQGVIV